MKNARRKRKKRALDIPRTSLTFVFAQSKLAIVSPIRTTSIAQVIRQMSCQDEIARYHAIRRCHVCVA